MNKYILSIVLMTTFTFTNITTAQDNPEKNNVAYLGLGSASGGEDENDDTPWSLGVLFNSSNSDRVFGFDISREGTMLDSTYGGYDALSQALSYNFLFGSDISKNKDGKTSIGLILGFIETEADCPDSYLGYQCYADTDPEYEHEFSGGGFLNYSVNEKLNLGLRATSHSTQVTIGFKF